MVKEVGRGRMGVAYKWSVLITLSMNEPPSAIAVL